MLQWINRFYATIKKMSSAKIECFEPHLNPLLKGEEALLLLDRRRLG